VKQKFASPYGYFSEDGREYIITTPLTPRPWSNVISNGEYGIIVSQTGSGYSWRGNAGQNRLTRSFQDLVKDNWGKYLYLRDVDRQIFWSATYQPVRRVADSYQVAHGIGYSRFTQRVEGIRSELTVFVAANAPLEFFALTLTNESDETRHLDVTSYAEWLLGFAPDEHREFHKLFIETWAEPEQRAVFARKYLWGFPDDKGRYNNINWPYIAFMAVSEPLKSFDCDKESFLGLYGSEAHPQAMQQPRLAGRSGRFGDAIAALQVEVALAPGKSRSLVFTLGAAEDGKEDPRALIERYTSPQQAETALQEVHTLWSRFLDGEHVETPDEALNFMTNYWLKYQTISGRLWGKLGPYQVSAGYGFRDQLQDCQIFLVSEPEYARRQILLHAAQQFIEGDVLHWWFTIRGGGPRTNCSDDLLWLPFILDSYLKETADYAILDEQVPYLNAPAESLYQHCKRAIERAFSRFSPRGIPLMGDHDWNDGLNAIGTLLKGESFWVAEFLYAILGNFIPLAQRQNDNAFAAPTYGVSVDKFFAATTALTDVRKGRLGLDEQEFILGWYPSTQDPNLKWFSFDGTHMHYNSDAFKAAIAKAKEMLPHTWQGLTDQQKANFKSQGPGELFLNQESGVRWDGGWMVPAFAQQATFKWDFIGFPGGNQAIVGDFLVVSKTTANLEEAYKFARWMSFSREGYLAEAELAKAAKQVPTRMPVFVDAETINLYLSFVGDKPGLRAALGNLDKSLLESLAKIVPGYVAARWEGKPGIDIGQDKDVNMWYIFNFAPQGKFKYEDYSAQLEEFANKLLDEARAELKP